MILEWDFKFICFTIGLAGAKSWTNIVKINKKPKAHTLIELRTLSKHAVINRTNIALHQYTWSAICDKCKVLLYSTFEESLYFAASWDTFPPFPKSKKLYSFWEKSIRIFLPLTAHIAVMIYIHECKEVCGVVWGII